MRVYGFAGRALRDRNPLGIFQGQRSSNSAPGTFSLGAYTCPGNRRARFQSHCSACITTALDAGQTLIVHLLDAAGRETGAIFFAGGAAVNTFREALNAPFELAATNAVSMRVVLGAGLGRAEIVTTLYGTEYDA